MKRALLAATIAFALVRCATVLNETTEKIPVRSTPAGAVVSVNCGDAPLYGGVTPTFVTVPRAAQPCSITIAKVGYVEKRIDFERQRSGATSVNRVAAAPAGIVGALVGLVLTSSSQSISADDAASGGYAVGSAIATASADRIDERTGGAFKQVPGEVDVTLEPLPTSPSPPP